MVVYPKYQEPLIALCVAMLAGCGFAVLVERRATSRLFGLAGILVLAFMLGTAGWYLPDVLVLHAEIRGRPSTSCPSGWVLAFWSR